MLYFKYLIGAFAEGKKKKGRMTFSHNGTLTNKNRPLNAIATARGLCALGIEGTQAFALWPCGFATPSLQMDCDGDSVVAVAISDDSHLAALGSRQGVLSLVDLSARTQTTLLRAHATAATSVVLHPSKPHAVTVSADQILRCWNLEIFRPISEFALPGAKVTSLSMHASRNLVLCGLASGSLCVLDMATAQVVIPSLPCHAAPASVCHVHFHPTAPRAYSAGSDGRLIMLAVPPGPADGELETADGWACIRTIQLAADGPAVFAMDAVGTLIVHAGASRPFITIVSALDLTEVHPPPPLITFFVLHSFSNKPLCSFVKFHWHPLFKIESVHQL